MKEIIAGIGRGCEVALNGPAGNDRRHSAGGALVAAVGEKIG